MITKYLHAAMLKAKYEILPEGTNSGEIPGFQGVWANADTLEACRNDLQEVLEGWLILGLQLGHPIPLIDGMNLLMEKEAA